MEKIEKLLLFIIGQFKGEHLKVEMLTQKARRSWTNSKSIANMSLLIVNWVRQGKGMEGASGCITIPSSIFSTLGSITAS